ncbi:MAG: phosphotransferase, partial [Actinomycetes bacterium]
MAESCLNLADLGPEPALLHGDFNPWNVVSGEHGVRIFDWTDAAFAHPFLDLTTYIMQCRDRRVRRAMLRRYLDSWVGHLPSSARTDIGRLALVVGALHQAHSHHRLIPTVLPDDLSQLRGGDVQWLRRAMRFSKVGLLSDY